VTPMRYEKLKPRLNMRALDVKKLIRKRKKPPIVWKEASCIINPRAANNKWERRTRLRAYLKSRLPGPAYDSHGSKEASVRLARELSRNHRMIVIIGGDGTISDVIQGIMEGGHNKQVRVGIIPFGSGNAFRNSLGIPKTPGKAVDLLTKGREIGADVVRVNGRYGSFINIGMSAAIGYLKHAHRVPGLLGHFLASRIQPLYRRHRVEVELVDGVDDRGQAFKKRTLRLKILDCVVSKTNHFGYGWLVAPKAVIDDGYLDITFFEMRTPAYFALFPFIFLGLAQRRMRHYKAKRAVIRGDQLPIQYNGEDLPRQDVVELDVVPHAVRLIVP
jgi:diacylglycerol kinase (ATP)